MVFFKYNCKKWCPVVSYPSRFVPGRFVPKLSRRFVPRWSFRTPFLDVSYPLWSFRTLIIFTLLSGRFVTHFWTFPLVVSYPAYFYTIVCKQFHWSKMRWLGFEASFWFMLRISFIGLKGPNTHFSEQNRFCSFIKDHVTHSQSLIRLNWASS
jgi:hypothetical protein